MLTANSKEMEELIEQALLRKKDLNNKQLEKALFFSAKHLSYQKNYLAAIERINEAISINPEAGYLFFNRADYYSELEDYSSQIEDLNQILKLDPSDKIAYYERGRAKFNFGDLSGSVEDFKEYLSLNGSCFSGYIYLGQAQIEMGLFPEGIESFEKAIEAAKNTNNTLLHGANPALIQLGRAHFLMGANSQATDLVLANFHYKKSLEAFSQVLSREENPQIEAVLADSSKLTARLAISGIQALTNPNKSESIRNLQGFLREIQTKKDWLGSLQRILPENITLDRLESMLSDFKIGLGAYELQELVIQILAKD